VHRVDEAGARQLLVQRTSCNPACVTHFRDYVAVAQSENGLTVLSYGIGLDGDPQESRPSVPRARGAQARPGHLRLIGEKVA
jgi:hypothetical protein